MTHETIPIPVTAHQQQLVSANVHTADGGFMTCTPGDWIVKWPDGRLEVFTDAEFRKTFRVPPPPYVGIRGPCPSSPPYHDPLCPRLPIVNPDVVCEAKP